MSCFRTVFIGTLALAGAAPLAGQGIPRGARRVTAPLNVPRLMVANPTANQAADSAASVQIAGGMRKRMEKVVGADYAVVSDTVMNVALVQYGYPKDAILSQTLNLTLAKNIPGTRVLVSSNVMKDGAGKYVVSARLAGVNDDAGYVATLARDGNQSLPDFGAKVADALEPGVKSLGDARACIEQRQTAPAKAEEAANKALKTAPASPLAHYCLALLSVDKKDSKRTVSELQQAAKNDNQSLAIYSKLAEQYQAQGDFDRIQGDSAKAHGDSAKALQYFAKAREDSAKTIQTFGDLLRVAPTNQKLRDNIFRYLLQAGKLDYALAIADSGIKLDPYNPDNYDLKSNACLFKSDFRCATAALEQRYSVDSSRVDSLFYNKILIASEQRLSDTMPKVEAGDTATFVKWAKVGAAKYPNSPTMLQALSKAYTYTAMPDSSIAVTRRLLSMDSTNTGAALSAAKALVDAKRGKEAPPFLEFAVKNGDALAKENAAALYYGAAAPYLQEPQDLPGAAELLRASIKIANPTGKVFPAANYLLGLSTLLQVPKIDPAAEKGKSCDLAKQEAALLSESETAFKAGRLVNVEVADKDLAVIAKYKPRVAAMQKSYCK